MTLLLFLTLVLTLWQAKLTISGFHDDCLSRETTSAVNGVFVLLVFLRHFSQYIRFGRFDGIFQFVDGRLNQLIVVPFLFYSGYGIMVSILRKGKSYVYQIVTRRFPKVWYHFALAVMLFALVRAFLGKHDSVEEILLSLTGWESIGNSNWYVFAILILYLSTFLSFHAAGEHYWAGTAIVTALCCIYILTVSRFKPHWWYDTLLAYPAGIAVALLWQRRRPMTNPRYLLSCAAVLIALLLCWKFRQIIWVYELLAVFFVLGILLVTMKVKPGNPVLSFLGKYTFEIYILQRIPMMVLEATMPTNGLWKIPYFLLCFILTIGLAVLFQKITGFLDGKLAYIIYRRNHS